MDSVHMTCGVTFYIRYGGLFGFNRLYQVPRVGDRLVFDGIRYLVEVVEWCLDFEVADVGTKVNIEMTKMVDFPPEFKTPKNKWVATNA